jgi:diguanylate cyclase (GGDEF)-like protein
MVVSAPTLGLDFYQAVGARQRAITQAASWLSAPAIEPEDVMLSASAMIDAANAQLIEAFAISALMLLAGMAMAWVLASYSIIRPLDALARAARRLRDGDISAQASLPSLAVSELGKLAAVFNATVADIADRDQRLERLVKQDALTGLANRRTFDATLNHDWEQAARAGRPMALIMIDVDHFKRYNDTYGHPAGDACLRTVATAIADAVRQSTDTAARYGGEEFAIILPEADVMAAMKVADRVVRQIAALNVPHRGAPSGRLSISAGVAAINPGAGNSAQWLIDAADTALYRAKNSGRNKAVFHHTLDRIVTSLAA